MTSRENREEEKRAAATPGPGGRRRSLRRALQVMGDESM